MSFLKVRKVEQKKIFLPNKIVIETSSLETRNAVFTPLQFLHL